VTDERPTPLPEIKDSVGFRPSLKDKQNLRILMAERGVTSVSDILRWCVAQQAEPVRQRWQSPPETDAG
jgi:hypothetical protein